MIFLEMKSGGKKYAQNDSQKNPGGSLFCNGRYCTDFSGGEDVKASGWCRITFPDQRNIH